MNAGMHRLGIAEPQLSLMARRAARILNRAHDDEPFELATTWRDPLAKHSPPGQQPVYQSLARTTEY